jgi:hypothetical protein
MIILSFPFHEALATTPTSSSSESRFSSLYSSGRLLRSSSSSLLCESDVAGGFVLSVWNGCVRFEVPEGPACAFVVVGIDGMIAVC